MSSNLSYKVNYIIIVKGDKVLNVKHNRKLNYLGYYLE